MTVTIIPIERVLFGNEHWRSHRAIAEIEVYCDLIDDLQKRIEALPTRGKEEQVTLSNVQTVLSSYAFEIGVKSLWALDHPMDKVPHTHDLLGLYGGLSEDSIDLLDRFCMDQGKHLCIGESLSSIVGTRWRAVAGMLRYIKQSS